MSLTFPSLSPIYHKNPIYNFSSHCTHRVKAVNYTSSTETSQPDKKGIQIEKKVKKKNQKIEELEVLYDDGFGNVSVKDYFEAAKGIIKDDGGPPRWFSPIECGRPLKNAPLLLFLPGSDGVGLGLIMHHKPLGKAFEVWCLHIPVKDRTPFEGLVDIVEKCIKYEHSISPNRPIYLIGDSFGGCLALSVAARNPTIDLVLVLANPATSFDKSPLLPIFPLLENLPGELHVAVPYLLSFVMGDPLKMALVGMGGDLPSPQLLEKLSTTLTSMLPLLSELAEILPRETLLWKLKLLKSGAAYTNSRLHAVKAPVLLLASGKDNLLPSGAEADRLFSTLKNIRVRYYKDNGHTLLLEDGVNLFSVIKSAGMYRRSSQHDVIKDYLPPTISEFNKAFHQDFRLLLAAASPAVFSTLPNGEIIQGFGGVPDTGPVLFVGYHMLMGLELVPLYKAFLEEKKKIIRALAHPILLSNRSETSRQEPNQSDSSNLFGAVTVNPINMYRLFERGEDFVLLYPGGAREALHMKGEEYKLFWPEQPEFVRMAARFGVTIIPFGVVGEDDLTEFVLDYNDMKNIPFVREWMDEQNKAIPNIRSNVNGEVSQQNFYLPGLLPKVPGRFYYLFGKPIETKGGDILKDRNKAMTVYTQIKSEIETIISYLKRKREEDPYRSIAQRAIFQATWGPSAQIPTFEP